MTSAKAASPSPWLENGSTHASPRRELRLSQARTRIRVQNNTVAAMNNNIEYAQTRQY